MTPKMSLHTDAQLVEWSRNGDRTAFATIVKKYQSLVCSITYNATGSLSLSEDLAQETFFAAWKQLSELREPARLRSWLCGITRFLVGKEFRRQGREPLHVAAALDAVQEPPSLEASPSMQAVSREEEAILWRALQRIPDTYREPLILFYREEKSVERVAAELELTEDAVRQRLSRGRKLLQEEVVAFVEGTLSRTAPDQRFSNAVLAMLPATSMAAAGAGVAGKGAAMAKSGSLAGWLVPWAPFVGILGGMVSNWLSVQAAPTARERRFQMVAFSGFWAFVLAWAFPAQFLVQELRYRLAWSDASFYAAMTAFWWFYAMVTGAFFVFFFRRIVAMRRQHEQTPGISDPAPTPPAPGSNLAMIAGVYVALFSWLIYVAWRVHDNLTAGIAAGLMVALFIWHFIDLRGRPEPAAMRPALQHVALAGVAVLAILNLRLNAWLAVRRGTDLAEIHRLLPVWAVPLATASLILWVGLLVVLTKPRASACEAAQR